MSQWPPPPDLESLKELFAAADVEGLIADGCPLDEYDPEAKHFFEATKGWENRGFIATKILPLLEDLWVKQFMLNQGQLMERRTALQSLADEVARFFGPEANPQVRQSS